MGTVYVFFADGFEEMEAFATVDILRRAGVQVQMVTVTEDEIVKGAHGVPVLCDKNIVNCDFFDAEMLVLPGGLPGATTLNECEDLRKLLVRSHQAGKNIAAICAAPMVLGNLGLLKGKKATCYPGFDKYLEGAEYTGLRQIPGGSRIYGRDGRERRQHHHRQGTRRMHEVRLGVGGAPLRQGESEGTGRGHVPALSRRCLWITH